MKVLPEFDRRQLTQASQTAASVTPLSEPSEVWLDCFAIG